MIPAAGQPQIMMFRDVDQVRSVLNEMGVSSGGVNIMDRKALFRVMRLRGLDVRAANILKQEMLSRGGEVATSRNVYEMGGQEAECLVMGTMAQYEQLLPKLRLQPFGLRAVAEGMQAALRHYDSHMPATHAALDLHDRPLLMGVVNVTPDSFSDPGDFFDTETAIEAGRRMAEEGAAFIDIGGESTRPGSDRVSLEEECDRALPVVRALAGTISAQLSIDTYRHEVAARALEAGALLVNDVSALRFDPEMVAVCRDADCPVIIMHMLGEPKTMQANPVYENVVEDIYAFFIERLDWAVDQGLREENLLIDVGIGFGKTLEHNLELLRHLDSFRSLGRPVVLGASRKSFLGRILDRPEAKERLFGTVATSVIAVSQEIDIIRVHDIAPNKDAVRVARAVFPVHETGGH